MRIGIISLYYNSNNYGGLLQAYALCRKLNGLGQLYNVEQVCVGGIVVSFKKDSKSLCDYLLHPVHTAKGIYLWALYKVLICRDKYLRYKIKSFTNVRKSALLSFEKSIPHSADSYNDQTICECRNNYDLFIIGSDQVWNYKWFNKAYFLNFTNKKISYAASLGQQEITKEWKELYRELLKDFKAISVREEDAISLLQPLSPVTVEWVLDPTLLLSSNEWDEICTPRKIKESFMFCYFLGGSKRDREIAIEVAKKKKLKIVTLPHLLGLYRATDKNFGDIQLWDIGPKEFISLIKHAEFVLTDSFHGSVFSYIYHRPFAVFERENANGMSSRIKSLTDLTETQDRFIVTPEMANAEYICSLPSELPDETEKMRIMKEKSINFLKNNIEEINSNNKNNNA